MGVILPGVERDFPPVFSWDWDGKRLKFVMHFGNRRWAPGLWLYSIGWIYSHRKGAEWRVACWGGAVLSVGDFLGAVSRSCARGRAGSVTRWHLKSRRVGTLVICIEETSPPITQPHTAYLAAGKRASGVADPAGWAGASVSRPSPGQC